MAAQIDVLVYDHNARFQPEPVTDFTTAKFTRSRVDSDGGQVVCPLGSTAAARMRTAHGNYVPVRFVLTEDGQVRDQQDGWVLDYDTSGPFGQKMVTANIISAKAVLRFILAWAAPALPLAVQPGYFIYIGPAVTGILNIIEVNARRLAFPLVVVRPDNDDSYLINYAARFPTVEDLIKDTLPELPETLTVRLWVPGDDPVPSRPELTRATFVVEFTEKVRRNVEFVEGDGSGLEVSEHGVSPTGGVSVVGGKSPEWLNKILSDGIETFFPTFGNALKDTFLAYQAFPDPDRGGWGVLAPPEAFVSGGTSAYTVDSYQAGRQALVDNGGRRQIKLSVVDGKPFRYGWDYQLGDEIGANTELDDETQWQPVTGVEVVHDRSGVKVSTSVGDDRTPQDAQAKLIGRVKSLMAMVNTISQGSS